MLKSKTDGLDVTVKFKPKLTVRNSRVLVRDALAKRHKNVPIMLKALERFCFIAFIVCESPVLFTGARSVIAAGFLKSLSHPVPIQQ